MKNTIRVVGISLFIALLGLSAGCTTVNTVERAEPIGSPNYVDDKRVITDQSLNSTVRILSVNEDIVSGNLRRIQVRVQNVRSSARSFSYRFEWFDDAGMQVTTSSNAWQSRRIQGKETLSLTAVAPNPRAVDFVLKLQEPK